MEKDITSEAKRVIALHTAGYMSSGNYVPSTNMELWQTMLDECASILTEEFVAGKFTPMEYNAVRNEIASILNPIFAPVCDKEHEV